MSKATMGSMGRQRTRVVFASILVSSLVLFAPGVLATEGESDEPIEVSHQLVLVVDTTEEYVVLAPQLSWSVPEDDPGVAPTGFEVRRTHQGSGEQVTFCVAGDANGLLDASVQYTSPEDDTELVEGNDYFAYEVRATRLEGDEIQASAWSEALSVRVSGRPAEPRETATDPAPAPALCPQDEQTTPQDEQTTPQVERTTGPATRTESERSSSDDGEEKPSDSTAPNSQGNESDKKSDPVGDQPSDPDETGDTSNSGLLSCDGSMAEGCKVGNAVWTPPGDGSEQEKEGPIPWEDISGWKFPWTSCWNNDGNVICTR